MKHVKDLIGTVSERLERLAKGNAVVSKPISLGDRHVVPLCELSVGFGGGGGKGEGEGDAEGPMAGTGVAVGGGAKAAPVAVLVIENGKVRIETLG